MDLHPSQAEVEVGSESPSRHSPLEVAARGGEKAHIDGSSLDAPERADELRVEDPEELRLGGRREARHVVQEKRAARKVLEKPGARLLGAGEGAFFVAKELRLEELRWQGGRLKRQKRATAPGAGGMNGPRHELFTGSSLTGDQDGRLLVAQSLDGLEDLHHRRGLANEAVETPYSNSAGVYYRGDLGPLEPGSEVREGREPRVREEAIAEPRRQRPGKQVARVKAPVQVAPSAFAVPSLIRQLSAQELDPPVELQERLAHDGARRRVQMLASPLELLEVSASLGRSEGH